MTIEDQHIAYYMRMGEKELKEQYYKKTKDINKRLGISEIISCCSRQDLYEIEQALKKREIKYKK